MKLQDKDYRGFLGPVEEFFHRSLAMTYLAIKLAMAHLMLETTKVTSKGITCDSKVILAIGC